MSDDPLALRILEVCAQIAELSSTIRQLQRSGIVEAEALKPPDGIREFGDLRAYFENPGAAADRHSHTAGAISRSRFST